MRPKITVALSTRGRDVSSIKDLLEDLSNQTFSSFEVLVVLQGDNEQRILEAVGGFHSLSAARIIVDKGAGLSRSRNIAMKQALGQFVLLADDDCRYPKDALEKIYAAIVSYPEYSFYTFRSISPNGGVRNARVKKWESRKHNRFSIMSVCSVEIVLSLVKVNLVPVSFDERFGLGRIYSTGAENIFLSDLMRQGHVGFFAPRDIVIHPLSGSGKGKGMSNGELAFAKGAMFRRVYGVGIGVLAFAYYFAKCFVNGRIKFSVDDYKSALRGFLHAPDSGL